MNELNLSWPARNAGDLAFGLPLASGSAANISLAHLCVCHLEVDLPDQKRAILKQVSERASKQPGKQTIDGWMAKWKEREAVHV